MTEPRTEAGRRLWTDEPLTSGSERLLADILAIEAEAAAEAEAAVVNAERCAVAWRDRIATLEAALSVERIERGLDSLYTYRENHLAAATLRAALLQNDSPLSHNAEVQDDHDCK